MRHAGDINKTSRQAKYEAREAKRKATLKRRLARASQIQVPPVRTVRDAPRPGDVDVPSMGQPATRLPGDGLFKFSIGLTLAPLILTVVGFVVLFSVFYAILT